ncbi:hypothetical protein G6F62_013402 [Rhizopus arrhizus]|nr:hypothetical protein G6F62_013402 [Rhizopus arrhizus]
MRMRGCRPHSPASNRWGVTRRTRWPRPTSMAWCCGAWLKRRGGSTAKAAPDGRPGLLPGLGAPARAGACVLAAAGAAVVAAMDRVGLPAPGGTGLAVDRAAPAQRLPADPG